jgi:hypothetical protein
MADMRSAFCDARLKFEGIILNGKGGGISLQPFGYLGTTKEKQNLSEPGE